MPGIFMVQALKVRTDVVEDSKFLLRERIEIDELNEIALQFQFINPQISYSCALKASVMANRTNYTKAFAESYAIIGKYFLIQRDYLSSMKYSLLAYDNSKKIGDYKIQSQALNQIGTVYYLAKRADRSVQYFSLALIAALRIKDTNQLINLYVNSSDICSDTGNFKIAKRYLFYSLFLSIRQKDRIQEAIVYRSIGIFYLRQKDYDRTLHYFEKSIEVNAEMKQFVHIGSLFTLMSHTFEQMKDLNSALEYNKIALIYRLRYNRDEQVFSSYLNIGYTYLLMGQLDSASYYLHSGIYLAGVYGFQRTHLLESGYKNLYELNRRLNNDALALSYYQKYSIYKDSVDDENNKRKISIIETQHYITEKEQENHDLKNENFIQRLKVKNKDLWVVVLVILSLLTILVAVYIQQKLKKNRIEKKVVEDRNDQLEVEIEEQVNQNEELSRREQEYRFLADHTADLVTLMDGNFKCLYISPSSKLLLGYSPEELMGMKDYRDVIHANSRKSFDLEFESMLEYRDATRFLYRAIKKDGTDIWVESNINPILDTAGGKLKAMLSITRDVTNQIDQEEALLETSRQKDILIREVHHRVKNNLAILTSLVNMQKNAFTDHKTLDIFADLQFRVKAMALVHEQLYRTKHIKFLPIGDYLSKLVSIVSSAFTTSRVKVHQAFLDEILDVEITLPLGLIVNELLTNSYKYAFPESKEGNIWVVYEKAPKRKDSPIEMRCLTVKDDGIGLPKDFSFSGGSSMGSQIIHLLTQQLEGELIIDGTKGASFSLFLPSER
jgi:PAS domain S-box-containing protein